MDEQSTTKEHGDSPKSKRRVPRLITPQEFMDEVTRREDFCELLRRLAK
jgi:hypothetical protein